MADDYNTASNWWDSSTARFDTTSSSSSSSGLTSLGVGSSFGWPSGKVDVKTRSFMDSSSVSDSFHDIKLQQSKHRQDSGTAGEHLHMMGLGLSSRSVDWNQALLRGEKSEGGFRMLQENLSSSSSYQQESRIESPQLQWREKMFTGQSGDSSMNEYKQISRGFSLEQPQFCPHGSSSDRTVTCQGVQSSFQIDSSAMYGLLRFDQHHQQQQEQQSSFVNRPPPFCYPYGGSYGNEMLASNSPPKQPPHNQLHFSNNAPFWNASASSTSEVRPSIFPSLQPQFPSTNFEEKSKNISDVGESRTAVKRSGNEASTKRPRNETTSPLPAFKVRKEKMGDRITALQQLVSPFGKTDTASVLSEAIEYIKFLQEQVTVLSTPYMKSGAPIHHQQGSDKSNDPEGQKQDLRSRGLCLVPMSSTFPVTHETTVDFWTPTFGGTFR